MKKINYVTFSSMPSSLPSSLQIIKTCESFAKNKYDVTLIKPGTGIKDISINKFYSLKHEVKIKQFDKIKKFPQGLTFYIYIFYCINKILRDKDNQSTTITRNYLVCFLLLFLKKRVILEIHHDIGIEGRLTKFILRYFNFWNKENLCNIVAISKPVKDLFIRKYKIKPEKITVLPSGSSIRFSQKPKFCSNKRLKIGYFGSISQSKGIDTLIRLSKIDLENDYYIYGGSKQEIDKIKKKNNNENLFLNQSVPYFKIPKIMSRMDIMTLPYTKNIKSAGEVDHITNYTSPLKLFDYLAAGKMIISSNLKVLKEILGSKNAIFVDNFENIFEWKKNITIIKNNKKKIFIFSKNNFRLSKKYDHLERVKKYILN